MSEERIRQVLRRAQAGDALTIGFIGGSITQGSLAEKTENCYARRVFHWWETKFPQAKLNFVNAGIGGTDSYFGVGRCEEELLSHRPDFVMVDFSVNDEANAFYQETYEGLLRNILSFESHPAVLLLYNVFYDTGVTAEPFHKEVAKQYGIPGISMKDTIYQDLQAGKYTRESISPDGLHPNDAGHEKVAGIITAYLEQIYAELTTDKEEQIQDPYEKLLLLREKQRQPYDLPSPVTKNRFQDTKRIKENWFGREKGDSLHYEFVGSHLGVQFRKTIRKPAHVVKMVVDQDEANPILLDGNFQEDWGDCIYLQNVPLETNVNKHTLDLTVISDNIVDGENVSPFLLYAFFHNEEE